MADEDAAIGDAVVVDLESASHLADHLADGGGGHFGIVGRVAAGGGKLGIHIFEVGKVYVDHPLEGAQSFGRLIAAAVVDHHRFDPAAVQSLDYGAHILDIMGGGDKAQERRA